MFSTFLQFFMHDLEHFVKIIALAARFNDVLEMIRPCASMIRSKNLKIVNGLHGKPRPWTLRSYSIRRIVSKRHNQVGGKCPQLIVKGFAKQFFELFLWLFTKLSLV